MAELDPAKAAIWSVHLGLMNQARLMALLDFQAEILVGLDLHEDRAAAVQALNQKIRTYSEQLALRAFGPDFHLEMILGGLGIDLPPQAGTDPNDENLPDQS